MTDLRRDSPPSRRPHVVFLSSGLSFPHGMAATSRASLYGRALIANGWRVTVLNTGPTERPGAIRNRDSRGEHEGIAYVYACGTTVWPETFVRRQAVRLRGVLAATRRLVRLKRSRDIECVHLWISPQQWSLPRFCLFFLLRVLAIPACMELNEFPWAFKSDRSLVERLSSPLSSARGVVVISEFLEQWVARESLARGLRVKTIRVPILVDAHEPIPGGAPRRGPEVLYASTEGYDTALAFVIRAMQYVWQAVPSCTLVITGWRQEAFQRAVSETPALADATKRGRISV